MASTTSIPQYRHLEHAIAPPSTSTSRRPTLLSRIKNLLRLRPRRRSPPTTTLTTQHRRSPADHIHSATDPNSPPPPTPPPPPPPDPTNTPPEPAPPTSRPLPHYLLNREEHLPAVAEEVIVDDPIAPPPADRQVPEYQVLALSPRAVREVLEQGRGLGEITLRVDRAGNGGVQVRGWFERVAR
ncbi:MAG: hypothetical protein Q9208_005473 [Pyrenodesmia sp. 3 TL-2023]